VTKRGGESRDEFNARRRERYANRSEEKRARDREVQHRRYASPEVTATHREAQRRYSATPEGKAKRREAQRQRRANRSDKPE
jgi:hypothetical protein